MGGKARWRQNTPLEEDVGQEAGQERDPSLVQHTTGIGLDGGGAGGDGREKRQTSME